MKSSELNNCIHVDLINPGQFFACCGLLELAHRMPDLRNVDGCFDSQNRCFTLTEADGTSIAINDVLVCLLNCEITGLTTQESLEREELEKEKRLRQRLAKKAPNQLTDEERQQLVTLEAEHAPLKNLSPSNEQRRKALGEKSRAGAIILGSPFFLTLDWWQTADGDSVAPKTWAGLQELHKVARAAQDKLAEVEFPNTCLDFSCAMNLPNEYQKKASDHTKTVEPFYFDARRFAHALDAGFSLDVQKAETVAHPVVELLALIGLQRFRPGLGPDKWRFRYSTWVSPLSSQVAAAVACGAIRGSQIYEFSLNFRDDQKRYKAFSFATPIGD